MSNSTRFVLFTILLQISLLVSASPAPKQYPELSIFARQVSNDNCGAGSQRCTNPKVSNFCCPTGTECIAVLGNTAVGCCPTGQDCRIISTSECSSIEGAVGSPSQLTRCSSGKCCPPGYLCDGTHCQLEFDSWPTSAGGSQPTPIPQPDGGNATALSEAQKQAGFISKADCPAVTAGGFAAGFAPGLVVGAALASLIFYVRNRKKENTARARSWSRMPSNRSGSRKGSRSASNEKVNSKVSSKQSVTIGYQPEVVVTAPSDSYDGLGVSIGGRHYAASNTSTQMFAQYDEPSDPETSRRGRHRVHGETPPLPSLAIHGADSTTAVSSLQSTDYLQPSGSSTTIREKSPSKKHKRKNSNPSFKDLANASRQKFRNLLSHENLKEQRGSLGSETSVGSSIHSSVFTSSERQSRGNRYPIAVQTGVQNKSKGSAQVTPTSLRHEVTLERSNTAGTDHTNIEDEYTPITPSNPRAFTNSDAPNPPPAPNSHILPVIEIPPHEHTLRPQLTSPELREQYLNIPQPLKVGDRTSIATEMTEVEGYRSPFHDRFQYGSYVEEAHEGSSDYSDDDRRSLAANSTYPSSFLDIHFDNNISPVSPVDGNTYSGKTLNHVPSLPVIPPLFQHKNKPIEQLAHFDSNLKSSGSRNGKKRSGSPIDRESVDITFVIDDPTHGVTPNWRNNHNVNSTGSNRTIGIGGAMTGGRYTMQTMEMNKF
ncbi:hypothetical protein TWF281_009085 [Arthrobotrys megalospora]